MPVQYISGDLFLSDAQTFAHGCNCQGRMGAGIAKEFKRRYPAMFKEYKRRCHEGSFSPGTVYLEKSTTPWILNLATQATTGGAGLAYVRKSFEWIASRHHAEGIKSIAMPRIAAGPGGLEWADVKGLLGDILHPLEIHIFVYEEFVTGVRGEEERGRRRDS